MNSWTEAFRTLQRTPQSSWRTYCDSLNHDLLSGWWANEKRDRILKTDLYEEAVGSGLCRHLQTYAHQTFGIDFSREVVMEASARNPGLQGVVADVRNLPFASGSFDGILSTSTLDHFPNPGDLLRSLHEIARVLRPGGSLILTLDNLGNPLIRLRQTLSFRLLHQCGILPYYVGYTCNFRTFREILASAGFTLLDATAIAHCPRLPAVVLARWVDRWGSPKFRKRFGRGLRAFEALSRWPTRFVTGNYFAVKAVRRSPEYR